MNHDARETCVRSIPRTVIFLIPCITSKTSKMAAPQASVIGAACYYIDPTTSGQDHFCPSCQDVAAATDMVQQSCSCQLRSCDHCLFSWAESVRELDPPQLPTCFQCREILDLSGLRPIEEAQFLLLEEEPMRGPTADEHEDEMTRRMNIRAMRPSRDYLLRFDQCHWDPMGHVGYGSGLNLGEGRTFYAGLNTPIEELIALRARYRVPETAFEYHYVFWVHPTTTISELGVLWNSTLISPDHPLWRPRSNIDTPGSLPTWTFEGLIMAWADRVGDLGMTHGSSFEIGLSET